MSYKNVLKFTVFSLIFLLGIVISCNVCLAAGLVINEIVAVDPYGGPDWIELYVAGANSVYLGDYSVVDDNEAHAHASLPAITLGPGEFLVIQATSEDPGNGFYYVPFGLGANDCVTLYKGSNIVDKLDWDAIGVYGFGRFPDGTGAPQTLDPTPNAPNKKSPPLALVINEVLVDDPGGGTDWIELYVAGTNSVYLGDYAVVDDNEAHVPASLPGITLGPGEFYVIKASAAPPNDGSFYVPFGLGARDTVTLYRGSTIVDVLDWSDGDAPVDLSYGRLPDGIGKAQTLTPTRGEPNEPFDVFPADKVIDVRLEMYDMQWQDMVDNPMAEQYQIATIIYDGIRLEDVAVRTKGNSSLMTVAGDPNGTRFSLKVDFNRYIKGQDLAGIQKLNFNNGFSDPTFIRELLSYDLMRALGVPAPRCCFANLYINDELLGLYTVVEQVDDEFVESHFPRGDGDLYKAGMGTYLLWDPNYDLYTTPFSTLALKTNEDTSDRSALITMLDELNNGGDYESVLDVDEVLRYFAVNTVLVSLDSYQGDMAQNFYLYEENGVFRIIPWDYNMSFGTFNMGCDRDNIMEFMIDEPTISKFENRPLIAKLLEDPEYLAIYHGYLNEIITGPFSPANMNWLIDKTAALIRPYVYADPTKFYTEEQFEETLTSDMTTDPNDVSIAGFARGFGSVPGLKTFVSERVASIRKQLDGLAPTENGGYGNCPDPSAYWEDIDLEDAIENVSPSSASPGAMGVKVTIRLDDEIMDLLEDQDVESVMIGTLEGYNIKRSGDNVIAYFDFSMYQMSGMQSVSVAFETPEDFLNSRFGGGGFGGFGNFDWEDFNPEDFRPPAGGFGGMPPGGMPPGGMFPGGMPPGGMFPGGFGDMGAMGIYAIMDEDNITFTESEAFQIIGSNYGMSIQQSGYGSMMPLAGYGYMPQAGLGYASQGAYGYGLQSGYGSMPQVNLGYASQGLFGYTPQAGYGYASQGMYGYAPQSGYGFMPQTGLGYGSQGAYGYMPQAGYGYGSQGTFGFGAQNGFGFPSQAGYGFAPQGGLGFGFQGGFGFAPQGGFPLF